MNYIKMNYRRASPAVSAPFLLWYIFCCSRKGAVVGVELSDENGWRKIYKCFKTKSINQDGKKYKL
jgi:hypothetical protein